MRTIVVINQSTVVPQPEFEAAVVAVQKQILEHFAPSWAGLSAELCIEAGQPGTPQAPGAETIYVLDDSDQQDALGYHEIARGDVPVGFVFAKTSKDAGDPWQTTLSHEVLEQLADPFTSTCAVVPFQGRPAAIEYEVADPVENDTYLIDGVPVSNFVLPAWFQDPSVAKGPFDYLRKLTAPLTLTPGGYVAYTRNLRSWQEVDARAGMTPRTKKYHRHNRRRG